jgi:hypothetical protein
MPHLHFLVYALECLSRDNLTCTHLELSSVGNKIKYFLNLSTNQRSLCDVVQPCEQSGCNISETTEVDNGLRPFQYKTFWIYKLIQLTGPKTASAIALTNTSPQPTVIYWQHMGIRRINWYFSLCDYVQLYAWHGEVNMYLRGSTTMKRNSK